MPRLSRAEFEKLVTQAVESLPPRFLERLENVEVMVESAPTREDLEDEAQTQQDSVESVRESIANRVNLNGYYNFRFFADKSETPTAFSQHHLGILMSKQRGRFNFLMELELQNVPHHPEIQRETEGGGVEGSEEEEHREALAAAGEAGEGDISGEGQVAVENAWMEYNHNRYLNVRVGKQLSPQYWWQNHYPNLTYSTALPIYLRELFPAELVGAMVHGTVARPVGASEFGVGYKFYVANNNFEGNSRTDRRDGVRPRARGGADRGRARPHAPVLIRGAAAVGVEKQEIRHLSSAVRITQHPSP